MRRPKGDTNHSMSRVGVTKVLAGVTKFEEGWDYSALVSGKHAPRIRDQTSLSSVSVPGHWINLGKP